MQRACISVSNGVAVDGIDVLIGWRCWEQVGAKESQGIVSEEMCDMDRKLRRYVPRALWGISQLVHR